jgi:hypothetical protein
MRGNRVSYFTAVNETLDQGVYVLYQGKIACSHGECNAVSILGSFLRINLVSSACVPSVHCCRQAISMRCGN